MIKFDRVVRSSEVDKTRWGDGPWVKEPDKVEWRDSATGYRCIANRNMISGIWCGYVAVPLGHPAHGRDRDQDLPDEISNTAHGGITYADRSSKSINSGAINAAEADPQWWFGFDCGHAGDYAPGLASQMEEIRRKTGRALPLPTFAHSEYRTLDYVVSWCGQLAAALFALAKGELSKQREECVTCMHCGKLPPVEHIKCSGCHRISCCVVTDDPVNWLCEYCFGIV